MYKRRDYGTGKYLVFIILDELCLLAAFVAAYVIRHGMVNPFTHQIYVNILVLFSLISFCLIAYGPLLDDVFHRGYWQEFKHTVSHVGMVLLLGAFYTFSTQSSEDYSRIVVYLFGIFYALFSYTVRVIWRRLTLHAKSSSDLASIFFITTEDRAPEAFAEFTSGDARLQYRIVGACITDKDCTGQTISGVSVNTNLDTYAEFLCREWCDEVYIALDKSLPYTQSVIDKLVEMGIVVHFEIENFSNSEYPHQIVEKFNSHNVLTMSMNVATARQLMLKRLVDVAAGIAGCLITLILTLILGPIIYIQSPGPIFFTQTRIGRNGRKFQMYKFRSMYMDAEKRKQELMKQNRVQDGMMFKMDHDPRIIGSKILPDGTVKKGVGNFIRDWSLDEFPQFFNVLIGNMSLCGTRPPTEDEWNKYELHHRARLAIKPGITGMWQVSGRSEITDFEEVVRLDKEYIKKWSLGLDFRIILKTFKVVLGKDGAM